METTPSDRVQLIGRSQLMHPGCCALCGSGNCEDGYVDTGIYYDYEGQVYFCMTCALQVTNVIGGFSLDEVALQKSLLDSTVAELSSVKSELEQANERLGHYDAILSKFNMPSVDEPVDSSDNPSDPAQQEPEAKSDVIDEPVKGSDKEQPVLVKSGTSTRRTNTARTQRRNSSTSDAGFAN